MKGILISIWFGFLFASLVMGVIGLFIGAIVLASTMSMPLAVVVAFILFWAVAAVGAHLA